MGFSLPSHEEGHNILLLAHLIVTLKFLDITMIAADTGLTDVPYEHPDAGNFLPSQFKPGQFFDLVLCDGKALRDHDRAAYREHKETSRFLTQETLALEHIKPGGTMIVLLQNGRASVGITICFVLISRLISVPYFVKSLSNVIRSILLSYSCIISPTSPLIDDQDSKAGDSHLPKAYGIRKDGGLGY